MLFKILRGPSTRVSKDKTEFHDGYAYFTPDDGGFYIDAEDTDTGAQNRIRVNPVMEHQDISGLLNKTGDASNTTATFTAPSARENIKTGEKLSVIMGKIAKWFSSLGTLAFKSSVAKSDLAADVQTSLGKADTVPTKVSELTNDANYITADQAPVQSVNGKTGAVTLESLQEFYFSMDGTLAEQNLTIRDPGSLGDMAHALNEQILTHGDLIPIETCRPCIIAQGTGDAAESQIVLKYAGVGQDDSLSIFSGIWHNAVNESQYSVSLLYKLGNPGFEQYNIVQLKNIDPSTTTPLAPAPLALTEDGSVGGGSVGTSTTYARGDHIHPSEVFICHIQKNSSTDLACDRTYAEIVAAYTAGKICIARLNNSCLYLNYYHRTKNLIHFLGTGRVSNSVIEIDINDNITLSTIRILPLAKQITLYKGAWDGSTKQQLVTVSGVLADPTLQEIRVMPVNAALDSPYIAAGVQCVAQATDNLTFACKTAPTEDIEVYVVIQDVNYRA